MTHTREIDTLFEAATELEIQKLDLIHALRDGRAADAETASEEIDKALATVRRMATRIAMAEADGAAVLWLVRG